MKPPPNETRPDKDGEPSKKRRTDEARRVVEEYAADLREVINNLRKLFN